MAFGFFSETFSDQGTMDDGTWQFCGLDRMQRLYAFGACFVIGFILSLVSSLILIGGNVAGFAILYSIGNLVSIFSLTFIIGIMKQVKTMFAPVRFWATTVYLSLLVVTLVLSILLHNFILSLILVIVQFAALVWYSASYIPYGREIIRRFFGSCVTSI
ncbi:Got1/Sft2-like family-domain-containing protein [Halteromyces radiatus]|uniref:Got1/Sft2-like family-domain-containing protein n=1 Tax=Halteromyces radiatus TaxID=101107 RepID=UPI0022208AF4|nr:Got1/Sft2-like family-domain-containing protein [Halteromyces radiatus]KAI8100165.1 Got1/Sft2-like family-domain-containing protein [Halteromyces radiatus]